MITTVDFWAARDLPEARDGGRLGDHMVRSGTLFTLPSYCMHIRDFVRNWRILSGTIIIEFHSDVFRIPRW